MPLCSNKCRCLWDQASCVLEYFIFISQTVSQSLREAIQKWESPPGDSQGLYKSAIQFAQELYRKLEVAFLRDGPGIHAREAMSSNTIPGRGSLPSPEFSSVKSSVMEIFVLKCY